MRTPTRELLKKDDIVFGNKWFERHQSKLLIMLNAPVVKYWFRWCLRIRSYDCSIETKIVKITPSSFSYGCNRIDNNHVQITTDFRTHDKFSKRLYFAFKYLWYVMHFFDWVALDRIEYLTTLSFGFSTLTSYPDPGVGGTTTCGMQGREPAVNTDNWATIRSGAGTLANNSQTQAYLCSWYCSTAGNTNFFIGLYRSIFTFDTSSLTSNATISASVISFFGVLKANPSSLTFDVDIYTATPASNSTLVTGDYGQYGSTSQTGSPISYSSYSIIAYNDFTFNATGISNISKTGISRFGTRNANHDVANSAPTWTALENPYMSAFFADQTGTTNDPKLVVTYTITVTTTASFLLSMI